MKKFKVFLLVVLILPIMFMFGGCFESNKYVLGIEKTGSYDNYSVFSIYYSDGSVSSFTVENGVNGKDGQDLNIQDIYDEYKKTNPDVSFDQFIEKFLSLTVEDFTTQDAINKALMSAVSIYAASNNSQAVVCGAGVIFKMEQEYSYILTNYHVTYSTNNGGTANKFYLYQYGAEANFKASGMSVVAIGDTVSATYVGGTVDYDLAILKCSTSELKAFNPNACAVTIASGYSVGEEAIAIGNPDGDGSSVSKGVVSVDSENISLTNVDNRTYDYRVMRIDTAVNGGNSGGGLFNGKGELIGIVNAKKMFTNSEDVADNIAYALPIDCVTKVADNIMFYGEENGGATPQKLFVGIDCEEKNAKCNYADHSIEISADVVVTSVRPSSVAQKIGVKVNDIIKSIKISSENSQINHEITRKFQFLEALLEVRKGNSLTITVERGAEQIELTYKFVQSADLINIENF